MKIVSVLLVALSTAGSSSPGLAQGTATPGASATASNPNLAVASVKLDHGVRVSSIVGATVYGNDGVDLGKIDDLVITKGDNVTLAVVSVGGFLGVGRKLVAFPYAALKLVGDRLTLGGVTPDALNGMPSFEY